MKKQRRVQSSSPDVYHGGLQTLVITGGTHVQDNRHHITHHHDNSQNFITRNEKTVFNDRVFGYIGEVKNAKGPIAAYRQETNVLHQPDADRSDPAMVPRSLKPSKHSTPSYGPAINYDKHPHHNQFAHNTSFTLVTPSRGVPGGKRKELPVGRLTLTGGVKNSSSTSRHGVPSMNSAAEIEAEVSQLSPEMQQFVANLELLHCNRVKNGRKEQRPRMSASRKPVKQRVDSSHWQGSSRDEACTESGEDGDDRCGSQAGVISR